jgi:hypothetical protein
VSDGGDLAARVQRDRDLLLRLLSVAASFAGLCIAGLGFLEGSGRPELAGTRIDELIALDALLFLGCVYLILWALRTTSTTRAARLSHAVYAIFLFALTTLIVAAIYLVYWVL